MKVRNQRRTLPRVASHGLLGIRVSGGPLPGPQQSLDLKTNLQLGFPWAIGKRLLMPAPIALQLGPVPSIHPVVSLWKYLHVTLPIRAKRVQIGDVASRIVVPPPAKSVKIHFLEVSPVWTENRSLLSNCSNSGNKDQDERCRHKNDSPAGNRVRRKEPSPNRHNATPNPLQERWKKIPSQIKDTSDNQCRYYPNDNFCG